MSSLQTRTERPPEGLARGVVVAPKWAVAALGAAVVLGAIIYLVVRVRRARKSLRSP
ncbi:MULTISPECIES: hypothetical protein [Polyangium]|uniref:Uncharacterized protein n=1 Tax=Polyangium sorediatum TaxID=889274 RepID=A0ABT6NQ83_9BACT|nr:MULTISPECIES: hypothetical protein [Polyangium]MDI1430491.1 hypothetical protein [Polyangium sorediatum]